jgi:predicted HD phosphohydrolase
MATLGGCLAASGDDAAASGVGDAAALELAARRLEALHVHSVYDAIAPHFSATRFAIWPKVGVAEQANAPALRSPPPLARVAALAPLW